MNKKSTLLVGVVFVVSALLVSGCGTYGKSAGLGGLLGAGTGAIIGHQSGHAGEGAAIGAAVGALTGLIVQDVKNRRAKTAQETAAQYSYEPSQGEVLTLESAQVLPSTVQAGNLAEASIQYALLGVGGGTTLTETRSLKRGYETLSQMSSKTFTRPDGTWVSTVQFKVPASTAPGQYSVVQIVTTAAGSTISSTTYFNVS